jgi:hypothetical protein
LFASFWRRVGENDDDDDGGGCAVDIFGWID